MRLRMIKRLYIIFVVLIYSCSPGAELSGRYASKQHPYSLTLNSDSTFSYRYKFEYDYEYSVGRWSKISKNTVTLNSHYKRKVLEFTIEHDTASRDNTDLTIITPDFRRKYYECLIFINDTLHAKQKCDSILSVSLGKSVDNVFFGFTADLQADPLLAARTLDTLYTTKFYPKDDVVGKSTLRVIYNDSLFNYKIFDSDVFKITRKGLIFNDPERKTIQTIPRQ
jgi:hypothetical protein